MSFNNKKGTRRASASLRVAASRCGVVSLLWKVAGSYLFLSGGLLAALCVIFAIDAFFFHADPVGFAPLLMSIIPAAICWMGWCDIRYANHVSRLGKAIRRREDWVLDHCVSWDGFTMFYVFNVFVCLPTVAIVLMERSIAQRVVEAEDYWAAMPPERSFA